MNQETLLRIDVAPKITLEGDIVIPTEAKGLVLFAHGSGSSRHSPRNRYVANELNKGGLATLLLDLLTVNEETLDMVTGQLRFDIGLLAERLTAAASYLRNSSETANLNIGIFGSSTGGGAALVAVAQKPEWFRVVVSRGGRPDLAFDALPKVQAPTLLIVGGNDTVVIRLNESAYEKLTCEKKLEIVPGASHLFEEPGALEKVAALARTWFQEKIGEI
jgi:putative phosphoribosyl transferase